MSRTKHADRLPANKWTVELLRFTLLGDDRHHGASLWERITGQPPDSIKQKPKSDEYSESGAIGDMSLDIISQRRTKRFDLVMRNMTPPDLAKEDRYSYTGVLSQFIIMMDKLLNLDGFTINPTRFAYGAIVHLPCDSGDIAYNTLDKYMIFDVDMSKGTDVLYRINRPRTSLTMPGLKINRLTTWQISKISLQSVIVSAEGIQTIFGKEPAPESDEYSCRVELDINTAVTEPLPCGSLQGLKNELVSLANELIENGDIG